MGKSIQRIQLLFGVIYVMITVIFAIAVSTMLINSSKESMENNASNLIAADAHQIELNVDNYLDTVETVCCLLFSDETYYGYYDTNPNLTEYERIVAKDTITSRIVDLGMMENFSDFGVIYPNDKSAGWISQTTESMFPNGGTYEFFSGLITDSSREEGWATEVMGNTDRIYFVKRLNPNAIAVLSFYTNEFDSVFTVPDELSRMTVRMVDSEGIIIYSTDESEVSNTLPSDIASMIGDQTGISAMDDNYLVTSNVLSNGWSVVTSIPTSYLMQDQVRLSSVITIIVIADLMLLVGLLLLGKYLIFDGNFQPQFREVMETDDTNVDEYIEETTEEVIVKIYDVEEPESDANGEKMPTVNVPLDKAKQIIASDIESDINE